MPFDAAIFDFDGTLVDSAGAKRAAFFALFPPTGAHRAVVAGVLADDPDGSRYRVIPVMMARMRAAGLALDAALALDDLVARYGAISEAAVRQALELPGAGNLLAALAPHMQLHVCSNTPEATVRAHVAARGWDRYFAGVDGHPTVKAEKVLAVIRGGPFAPQRVAVIGDGLSDEEAAGANGCRFFAIRAPHDLAAAGRVLGARHV